MVLLSVAAEQDWTDGPVGPDSGEGMNEDTVEGGEDDSSEARDAAADGALVERLVAVEWPVTRPSVSPGVAGGIEDSE